MEHLQLPLLWFMLAAYIGAMVVYGFSFWSRNIRMRKLATSIVYIGLALNTLALLLRTALIKGLPLKTRIRISRYRPLKNSKEANVASIKPKKTT